MITKSTGQRGNSCLLL